MHSIPIRRGAIRPQDRSRHALLPALPPALLPALIRLAAIAGLALAGWIALSALHGGAEAAEGPAQRSTEPVQTEPVQTVPVRHAAAPARADEPGYATIRHFTSRPGWQAMTEDVRELGDHPMEYLRSRRQDLVDDKDKAVGHVRRLADEAGVPRLRVPDVRQARPDGEGLVPRLAGARPAAPRPAASEPREQAERPDVHVPTRHAAARKAPAAIGHTAVPRASADRTAGDCMGCRGDHGDPAHAPVAPAPDAPSGGGSAGGHPLFPVADLPHRRGPAAPPAVDASTFHRTALTDVAAPGGPSVVPD
ncbi:hypothetical protein AB0C74_04355 [Spirillospora sp. NPDC048832]